MYSNDSSEKLEKIEINLAEIKSRILSVRNKMQKMIYNLENEYLSIGG